MLPYQTSEEAEVALGRGLTYLESLWFTYSSPKPDYFLFFHGLLLAVLVFSLVPLPLVLMELTTSKSIAKFKLQPKGMASTPNMLKSYREAMRGFFLVGAPINLISYPTVKMLGIRTSLPLPSGWEVVLQLLVYFIVEDYANYWVHRLVLHSKWGYEKIHKVHHEFTAPTGYAAPYTHWAELCILAILLHLGPAIVPCHMVTLWVWIFLRQVESFETHSGYGFPWNPTNYIPFYGGAEHHDYHHYVGGKSHSNFASVFTYCDYIYGTDKGYRYRRQRLKKLREKSQVESVDKTEDHKSN